jgi:hypothetical protein
MKRERVVLDKNVTGNFWVKVRVTYLMGGHNWMSGNNFSRGYYLSVSVVEREQRDGYVVESTILGRGFKSLLKDAARFSQKVLDTVIVPAGLAEQLADAAILQAGLIQVAS